MIHYHYQLDYNPMYIFFIKCFYDFFWFTFFLFFFFNNWGFFWERKCNFNFENIRTTLSILTFCISSLNNENSVIISRIFRIKSWTKCNTLISLCIQIISELRLCNSIISFVNTKSNNSWF